MITDLRLLVLALSLSLPLFRLYTRLPTLLSFISIIYPTLSTLVTLPKPLATHSTFKSRFSLNILFPAKSILSFHTLHPSLFLIHSTLYGQFYKLYSPHYFRVYTLC